MSAPPYMKLFVADYLADTTHLTTREHGAYFLLLMAMWRAGGTLPSDDRKLAAISKCSAKEWADMRPTILEFFKRRGGLLTHKRVAQEIAKYEDISDKRSRARNGTRSEKAHENNGEADPFVDQTDHNSGHNQNHNHSQKKPPVAPKGAAVSQVDVDAIWALASKVSRGRSGKEQLRLALAHQAKRGIDPETIRAGMAAYFDSEEAQRDDGKFVAGVHLLVKNGRWEGFVEDEPPPLFRAAPAAVTQVDEIGSLEQPGPRRQRSWMEDWREIPAAWREHERGPRPGEPGCRVSPELQREFGVEPARPQSVGGKAA